MMVNNTLKWEVTEGKILLYHVPLWEEILLIKMVPQKLKEMERAYDIFLSIDSVSFLEAYIKINNTVFTYDEYGPA